ncbi:MAG: magnesium transporter CorA family protein [Ilumatobacteraceae bacterium]
MLQRHRIGQVDWVDAVDPSDEELDALIDEFHLDGRAFVDAHRRAARPTMQSFEDHVYVVAFSGSLDEIDMYVGPTWFVTIRDRDAASTQPWDPSTALERCHRRPADKLTSGMMLLIVLDELVDGYFDATDTMEDRVESLEDRIFEEPPVPAAALQQDLFSLRRQLLGLRRAVIPLREVLASILRDEVRFVTGDAVVAGHYVFDKLLRAIDLVDEQRELLGNAVDAHLAVMSNQMNLVMKKLTAWGSILFGATLIAGIYGMNFTHMPELRWHLGYPLALATMAVVSWLLWRMFRKRDWL